MGFDDIVNKGKEAFENAKEKVSETLHSDKFEETSDKVLDAAAEGIKKVTPDNIDAKVDEFRDGADKKIGKE